MTTPIIATPILAPKSPTMGGKPVLYRDANSIVNLKSFAFGHKLLCDDLTFSCGDSCVFSCPFCYVEATPVSWNNGKLLDQYNVSKGYGTYDFENPINKTFKDGSTGTKYGVIPRRGKNLLGFTDVVIRRRHTVDTLRSQLLNRKGEPKFMTPENKGKVVYASTLVDVAASMELVRETAAICNLILEFTSWDIRLLSKSSFLPYLIELIDSQYHQRIILGVSTGTPDDHLAEAMEVGTHLVSKRIKSLHKLQDAGFRTFGMICPSLPQTNYDSFAKEIADMIRVDRCEHVWAEVINLRGQSFKRTLQSLRKNGFLDEADLLTLVTGSKSAHLWEDYARATFEAHAKIIPAHKLRFLQYVTEDTYDWWKDRKQDGAVLLGKYAEKMKSAVKTIQLDSTPE